MMRVFFNGRAKSQALSLSIYIYLFLFPETLNFCSFSGTGAYVFYLLLKTGRGCVLACHPFRCCPPTDQITTKISQGFSFAKSLRRSTRSYFINFTRTIIHNVPRPRAANLQVLWENCLRRSVQLYSHARKIETL